jgi:hypothetical protein
MARRDDSSSVGREVVVEAFGHGHGHVYVYVYGRKGRSPQFRDTLWRMWARISGRSLVLPL